MEGWWVGRLERGVRRGMRDVCARVGKVYECTWCYGVDEFVHCFKDMQFRPSSSFGRKRCHMGTALLHDFSLRASASKVTVPVGVATSCLLARTGAI